MVKNHDGISNPEEFDRWARAGGAILGAAIGAFIGSGLGACLVVEIKEQIAKAFQQFVDKRDPYETPGTNR